MDKLLSVTEISWTEVLSVFCATSKAKSNKCVLRLLDTVIADDDSSQASWFFTTKNGVISRKKDDKISPEKILERFSQFSLSNPNNSRGFVGVCYFPQGDKRQFLSNDELLEIVSDDNKFQNCIRNGNFLQVFLQSHGDIDGYYHVEFTADENDYENKYSCVIEKIHTGKGNEESIPVLDKIRTQIEKHTIEIVDFLKNSRSIIVIRLIANFIVDDNEHAWLSNIAKMVTIPYEKVNDKSKSTTITSLPAIQLPLDSSSSSMTQSSRDNISAGTGTKHRRPSKLANAILNLEGSVYCSTVSSDHLPGLCAWVMIKTAHQPSKQIEKNVWVIDLSKYSVNNISKELMVDGKIFEIRKIERHVMKIDLIELIIQSENLLLGQIPINNIATFELAWQDSLTRTKDSLSQKIDSHAALAEVVVCGNTYSICKKLESIRETGFISSKELNIPLPIPIPFTTENSSNINIKKDSSNMVPPKHVWGSASGFSIIENGGLTTSYDENNIPSINRSVHYRSRTTH